MKIAKAIFVIAFVAMTFGSFSATAASKSDMAVVDRPRVLVFGLGNRCRYCVQLKKDITQVLEKTGDAVVFQDILVDRETQLTKRYRVVLSPTLVFLDAEGSEVFRYQGLLNSEQILEKLVALKFWSAKS